MRYQDLVQFDPIDSVIQLTDANDADYANQLLSTYVISDRMAEVLDELVIEQLQFNRPADNKGLLIVGNYGTGKSHLMSVISTIAEREGTSNDLQNARVAERAKAIEGKFKVIRIEIGAVQTSLRDIICSALEEKLAEMDVDFAFPPVDEVRNNKEALTQMMAAFHEVYPDHGLLLAVDELLDFLKSRKEQDLFLDLNFMREVGEICQNTRFRFMAGVQEMLFDNPAFQFVAAQLRRVKERFEQVRIVREDIAYVVSERLLKKDERQQALIREHLLKFTKLYDRLAEDLEQYVRLFPIHPEYLATFEKVTIAEKRVILKTLSYEMKKMMAHEVPTDEPGLLSFDSYWPHIEADPSIKSDPNLKEVMAAVKVLQDRIQYAFPRPLYRPVAQRIVNALAVFRLTTDDIYAKIGLTPTELRDGLFLHFDVPDDNDPADFLEASIESVLREIQKAVTFQYISANEANGQYYLDIKKNIAVDERIAQKAEGLANHQLDRYYFEALKQATEVVDTPYVTGYKIWSHRLPWDARRVTREGYIFFGAPNERSTAQPPRDFYMYMLQPFDPPPFTDEERADEVFFRLVEKDDTFLSALKLYAGAQELAQTASSSTKKLYEQKADEYLKRVVRWIKDNFLNAFEVTYRGKTERIAQFGMLIPQQGTVKEIVDAVAASYLSEAFAEKYPDYPSFKKLRHPLTKDNLPAYVLDAFKQISGTDTKQGLALLDGLVLLEGDRLNPRQSGFARPLLDLLQEKGHSEVVNRSALIETVYTGQGTEDIERTRAFHLEPELYVVVLAALVYNGDIVLTVNGKSYDAMHYEQLIRLPLQDITHFSHVKKPSGLPLSELNALFDLLALERSFLQSDALRYGIIELQKKAQEVLKQTAEMLHHLKNGILFMNEAMLSNAEVSTYNAQLTQFKAFLESLLVYNTPAKLHNFRYTADDIAEQQQALTSLTHLQQLRQRISECVNVANYIESAIQQLHAGHAWRERADRLLTQLIDAVRRGERGQEILQQLQQLQAEYKAMYMEWHGRARLSAMEEDRQSALLSDERVTTLQTLAAAIDLLPEAALAQWKKKVSRYKACWKLTTEQLQASPICPHCRFSPRDEYAALHPISFDELEDELELLLNDWVRTLVTELHDAAAQESIALLEPQAREMVETFLKEQQFTLPLAPKLVQSVKEVLQGIDRVTITNEQLTELMGGGRPLTVEELRNRFEQLLQSQIGNRPTSRVRIMLQQGEE